MVVIIRFVLLTCLATLSALQSYNVILLLFKIREQRSIIAFEKVFRAECIIIFLQQTVKQNGRYLLRSLYGVNAFCLIAN